MNKNQPAGIYQTGATPSPKKHTGIVSFLLSATIVICCISTVFSLLRINLLQKWDATTENQTCALSFSEAPQAANFGQQNGDLRIRGESVNSFWQTFHQLPQGIYVTQCYDQPLCVGDVITRLDNTPVFTWEGLDALLAQHRPGDTVKVTVFRENQQLLLELTIYE